MTPHRLTDNVHSQSRSLSVQSGPVPPATPALLTMICATPSRSRTSAAAASSDAALPTSARIAITVAPAAASARSAASSAGCSTSSRASLTCSAASRCASERPIPLAPPVMTATLPVSSCMPASVHAAGSRVTPLANQLGDGGAQLGEVRRLHDVVEPKLFEPVAHVLIERAAADQDEATPQIGNDLAHALPELEPVHPGHHQIAHDHVPAFAAGDAVEHLTPARS